MTHIVPLILHRIADVMRQELLTAVDPDDPARIHEVKVGRYQQNPSEAYRRLAVMHGDIDEPQVLDAIAPRVTRTHPLAYDVDAREIGGTEVWYRRGIVLLELYFINDNSITEAMARERAYEILGRVQNAFLANHIRVYDLEDEYGEHAIMVLQTASSMTASGGPPASWIYRGKVFWDCQTERNP
jgi:hypothetical protein